MDKSGCKQIGKAKIYSQDAIKRHVKTEEWL